MRTTADSATARIWRRHAQSISLSKTVPQPPHLFRLSFADHCPGVLLPIGRSIHADPELQTKLHRASSADLRTCGCHGPAIGQVDR